MKGVLMELSATEKQGEKGGKLTPGIVGHLLWVVHVWRVGGVAVGRRRIAIGCMHHVLVWWWVWSIGLRLGLRRRRGLVLVPVLLGLVFWWLLLAAVCAII